MEERENSNESGVGVGSVLSPGTFKVEGEVMLLRVRLKDEPLVCLIDGERRVREIFPAPKAAAAAPPAAGGVAFDASRAALEPGCSEDDPSHRRFQGAASDLAARFAALVQRYAGEPRTCLKNLEPVLDPGNPRLGCEYGDGGAAGLKAYLVRELFKRTVREERGFKILLLLSQVIALNGGGRPERLEPMTLEQHETLLMQFLDFLNVVGRKRIDPRIFEEIQAKFNDRELVNLSRGGTGFFIKPTYIQEMQELKSAMLSEQNSNYIEQLYRNAMRDSLDLLHENPLAYLKAMAIVRLYARSNRRERGGDSRIVERILGDLIRFRPDWVHAAGEGRERTA
jgi:hypothetical protein